VYTSDGEIIPYEDSDYDNYDDYIDALSDAMFGHDILRDTLIPLSKDFAILYREYNEKLNLWYKLHIVNLNKKDTVAVAPLEDCNVCSYGSYLLYDISPNFKYVIVDIVSSGLVDSGIDGPVPFLHDVFKCMIVDIEKAEALTKIDGYICGWEHIDIDSTGIFIRYGSSE
jgi:hypothetical protein